MRYPCYPIRNYALFKNNCAPDYTWRIDAISRVLVEETYATQSHKTFFWETYPRVGARANFAVSSSGIVSMWLDLFYRPVKGPLCRSLDIVSIPTVYYVLVDRATGRHIVRSCHTQFGQKFDYSMTFRRQLFHKSWLASPTYNIHDSVEIEVYVDPLYFNSREGVLYWTVKEFQVTKRASEVSEGDEGWFFCTGDEEDGYAAQVRLAYNGTVLYGGNVETDLLRIRIAFCSGVVDDYLPRTFPHLTHIKLMNPEYPKSSLLENTIGGSSVFEFDDWHLGVANRRIIDAERLLIYVSVELHVSIMVASLVNFQLGEVRPRSRNSNKNRLYIFRD